jgi:mannose-1-phosphate guanylyltransferase
MKALLLAAGKGTRLKPLTNYVPKCLVPIMNRPLLEIWLDLLDHDLITDVLVNTHHLADQVVKMIAESEHNKNITIVHEDKLLNTGGTIKANRKFFGSEPLMVIHADNLSLFDLNSFYSRFSNRPAGVEITMMTFVTDSPSSCGLVTLSNDGIVNAFVEKPKVAVTNLANAAVYIISSNVVDYIAELNCDQIDFSADVIPKYVGRINTFHNDLYHRDIGNRASLMQAQSDAMNNKLFGMTDRIPRL